MQPLGLTKKQFTTINDLGRIELRKRPTALDTKLNSGNDFNSRVMARSATMAFAQRQAQM